ncbi:hypothetical protein EAL2_c01250 [Peptoclostridium acidaminophilum DSM 3953]|uniref:DUF1573 domain-containing protein n=1 Tax=Peptoclostridium acidaminophilum DSM 3953 TaxID=1286171 RepID=W8T150_PEPAC|nr:hypothetical protein [Peptoclostridium acidaminophilum]AHM55459.1 hypothetical protein EAL2_c01250 [Peptoclostridium acidaminophilum DSM 3953]
MSDFNFNTFETRVSESLIRHKSILDVITKLQESASKVNRAIVKSATDCGCIEITAKKQSIPSDITYSELSSYLNSHVEGELCENCRDVIEAELGNHLFYVTSLCNILDIDFETMLKKEHDKIGALGKYSLL